jgi:hypothetical protein
MYYSPVCGLQGKYTNDAGECIEGIIFSLNILMERA